MRKISWIGLAGAILFSIGYYLLSGVPGGGEVESADFQQFYVTDDKTGMAVIALYLLAFGALGMLWFLWELRVGIGTPLSQLGFVSGAVGLGLILAGAALLEAPSGVQAFGGGGFVGEQVAHALAQAGWAAILIGGALSLALAIAVLSAEGRRTGSLPGWVAVTGFVAAALQLLAAIWIPSLAIPLWFLLAAAAGIRTAAVPAD